MRPKKIPIGESDFKTVVQEYYYIDKTLHIKDVMDGSKSMLITRPRRFGKTLSMTMLNYFYDINTHNRDLFKGLNIETVDDGVYMEKCGKHPVLFMTFKDLKSRNWADMYVGFTRAVLEACKPFIAILTHKSLLQDDLLLFDSLFAQQLKTIDFQNILKSICRILTAHYGVKPVILIDEYDTPVIASYSNGYYKEMMDLMKDFLSGGLKDNPYLEKGVLTGITRIAKESVFSGLNNFEVFSILESKMSDKFGFTQQEVHQMLREYEIKGQEENVKLWYNNYIFGKVEIYNPWSILNFVNQNGAFLDTFWVNTSDNALIRELMFHKSTSIRNNLDKLIKGEWLTIHLEKNLSFSALHHNIDAVWNLLLFSGYLKHANIRNEEEIQVCDVCIPNKEVRSVYKRFIIEWVESTLKYYAHDDMLHALVTGQVNIFRNMFRNFVETVFSFHDTAGKMPEKFYHAFLLGLIVKLEGQYHILSNREIGYGRADICLVPKKNKDLLGIIIELKSPNKIDNETLSIGLDLAEKQIIAENYALIMEQYDIPKYLALAIAVQGKKCMVKEVNVSKD